MKKSGEGDGGGGEKKTGKGGRFLRGKGIEHLKSKGPKARKKNRKKEKLLSSRRSGYSGGRVVVSRWEGKRQKKEEKNHP